MSIFSKTSDRELVEFMSAVHKRRDQLSAELQQREAGDYTRLEKRINKLTSARSGIVQSYHLGGLRAQIIAYLDRYAHFAVSADDIK